MPSRPWEHIGVIHSCPIIDPSSAIRLGEKKKPPPVNNHCHVIKHRFHFQNEDQRLFFPFIILTATIMKRDQSRLSCSSWTQLYTIKAQLTQKITFFHYPEEKKITRTPSHFPPFSPYLVWWNVQMVGEMAAAKIAE